MANRIFHPTAGERTTTRLLRDEEGHYHRVYGRGGFEGRGVKEHHAEPDNWQSRHGVDIIVPAGTPVYAAFSGVIGNEFGLLPKHAQDGPDSKYFGNRLTLEGSDNRAYYQHLDRFADTIYPGATVVQGQLLGYSGTAGNVQHLHFAIEKGDTELFLKEAVRHATPAQTSEFTDLDRGPVSDDFTRDRSDPASPAPAQSIAPAQTPTDANSTDARTGNAVRASESTAAGADATLAGPVAAPLGNIAPPVAADAPPVDGALPVASTLPIAPDNPDAGVPPPERPDAGYVIPPPMGLKGGEWFDPDAAGAAVLRLESQIVNLVPGIGLVKGVYEAISGYDVLTDDKLGVLDRAINLLPAVALTLKEMSAAAKLEATFAEEARAADQFSSAMREIAIASGDADMLVDSLVVRIDALQHMQMTPGSRSFVAELLVIEALMQKLIDRIDTVADVAGVLGALPPNYDQEVSAASALATAGGTPGETNSEQAGPAPTTRGSQEPPPGPNTRFAPDIVTLPPDRMDISIQESLNAQPAGPNTVFKPDVVTLPPDHMDISIQESLDAQPAGPNTVFKPDVVALPPDHMDISIQESLDAQPAGPNTVFKPDVVALPPDDMQISPEEALAGQSSYGAALEFFDLALGDLAAAANLPALDLGDLPGAVLDALSSDFDTGIQGLAPEHSVDVGLLMADATGFDAGMLQESGLMDAGMSHGFVDLGGVSLDTSLDAALGHAFDPGLGIADLGGPMDNGAGFADAGPRE